MTTSCNSNCIQGRACDCVAGYPKQPRKPMTDSDVWWVAALAFASLLTTTGAIALLWSYR